MVQPRRGRTPPSGLYNDAHDRMMEARRRRQQSVINTRSNSPVFQPRTPSNSPPPEWAGGKNKSRKTKSRKTKSRKMKPRRLLRAMII